MGRSAKGVELAGMEFRNSAGWRRPRILITLLLFASISFLFGVDGALLQGCNFGEELCDQNEVCLPDGLFGQCYSDVESEIVKPLVLEQPLDEFQNELLRTELSRLASNGLDWPHARSQCVLAYFKLSVAYQLDYDTEFCSVRNPNNIWSLVQRVQNTLVAEQEEQNEAIRQALQGEVEELVVPEENLQVVEDLDGGNNAGAEVLLPVILVDEPVEVEDPSQMVEVVEDNSAIMPMKLAEPKEQLTEASMNSDSNDAASQDANAVLKSVLDELSSGKSQDAEKRSANQAQLSEDEEKQLDEYVKDLLNNRSPNLKALSSNQLDKLISFIDSLQTVLKSGAHADISDPEIEEIIPLTSENNQEQLLLLKKDAEKFQNVDMGLANTVHKIVKGGVQRVEGNRVYLKVARENITEEELYKLIAYLDRKIAEPNNLYFDEFLYEEGQLSFRISRLDVFQQKKKSEKELENASGVAQAVYKRRKDIQTLAGVEVDETGIGSGVDVVPVEKAERDWLFVPILAVCALTIASLLSVLAVHMFYKRSRTNSYKSNLPEVIDHLEGKPCTVYEDLCRQRMSGQDMPVAVNIGKAAASSSKHSSTSSWPDECLLQTSNLDISTGHVILSFLQDCLKKPNEIADQWNSLEHYEPNIGAQTSIASSEQNASKNFDKNVLPYDESMVVLNTQQQQASSSNVMEGIAQSNNYINASKIHDSDPRQIAYIATQSPLQNTANDFWSMVWEQGVALIVNLCDQDDQKGTKCVKYWPEEGSKVYGIFEIYLVSEHIWSEDYVVRSLYLKNLNTNETRTVTQFHYLTWSDGGVPLSLKSLLEFRRKINKSYRGHSSPVLVHCTNGSGRTGAFCLIDMAINRILKGVKELNLAGSLEYLRDQRMGMVENEEQFKFVFSCVAEEVSSLLKNLQH